MGLGASTWKIGTVGATSVTSTGITTQATGSTFIAVVSYRLAAGGSAPPGGVTDSFGNTYALAKSVNLIAGFTTLSLYYCINGAGGVSHTATAGTWSTGADLLSIALVEFTGVGAGTFDLAPTGTVDNTGTTSITAPSITTSVANELVVNCFVTHDTNTATITDSGSGFAIAVSQGANTGQNGAVSWAAPASSGTAAADIFSHTSVANYAGSLALSIKPAVAAGGIIQSWQQQAQMGVMVAS